MGVALVGSAARYARMHCDVSIVETCVMPTLLYGAESWILNATLLQKLESFQQKLQSGSFVYHNTPPTMLLAWLFSGLLSEPVF